MSDLRLIQQALAQSIRNPQSTAVLRFLAGEEGLVERRLAIYRANVAANAAKALSAAYPVLHRVVGEECFAGLAQAYRHEVPSSSGDLSEYGGAFAGFLDRCQRVQSLPYLPELARLEWQVHRAYGAADAQSWDPVGIRMVAPERQHAVRFKFAAGTSVVESLYPLVRIWTIHQPGFQGEFEVDWSVAERALVARDGLHVTVTAAGAGDAAFIVATLNGARLGDAAAAALDAEAAFDLSAFLSHAITSNRICGFSLDEDH